MPKMANMVASAVYSTVSTTKMTTVAVEASTSRLPDVNASTMVTMVIVKSTAVAPPAARHSTPNTFTAKGRRLRSMASRSARIALFHMGEGVALGEVFCSSLVMKLQKGYRVRRMAGSCREPV